MLARPITVTRDFEVVDGVNVETTNIDGCTVSTVAIVTSTKPIGDTYKYMFWDQPVQDRIDWNTVEGTNNFIAVIQFDCGTIIHAKYDSLTEMQEKMDKAGELIGFLCPRFYVRHCDIHAGMDEK